MLPVIPWFKPFGNKVRKEEKKKETCGGLRLLIVVTRGGILMTGLRLAK